MRSLRLAILFGFVIASLLIAPAAAEDCRFVLGFKAIHDALPAIVGDCKVNEHYNPANGDALQETSRGLLAWRKADNFTAFTDGYRTWVNGPFGVQQRLNTERFDWEGDAAKFRTQKDIALTALWIAERATSIGNALAESTQQLSIGTQSPPVFNSQQWRTTATASFERLRSRGLDVTHYPYASVPERTQSIYNQLLAVADDTRFVAEQSILALQTDELRYWQTSGAMVGSIIPRCEAILTQVVQIAKEYVE